MTEKEYLKKLKKRLSPLNREERERVVEFYREMIADLIESGKTESEAVAELESVDTVAKRTIEEERAKEAENGESAKPSALVKALVIVGSPVWLALAIVALSIVIALLAVVLALIIALVAVAAGLTLGGVGAFVLGGVELFTNVAGGLFGAGMGLVAFVLGALAFALCRKLWKRSGGLLDKIFKWRKEQKQ